MATWTFLNAYLSSIPATQRQQLSNSLFGQVNSGQLSSIGEYETRLATGLQQLELSNNESTFTYRPQQFRSLTSSANYNDMENVGITNLRSLFTEAVLLEQAIGDHSQITAAKLDTISAAIGRMEKQVDVLEILAANTDGYISSVFNSFDEENTNRLERFQTPSSEIFIVDGPGFLPSQYDAIADSGSLRLPISKTIVYRIESIDLDSQVPAAPDNTTGAAPGTLPFSLAMLLDNNPDTYWAQTIDTEDSTIQSASVDIVANLLGVQQLSRITLDPFSRYPYQIVAIGYRKKKDIGQLIPLSGVGLPLNIESKTLIEFPTIYAEQLIISIRQTNRSALRYVTNSSNDLVTSLFDISTGEQLTIPDNLQGSNAAESVYFAMTSNMKSLLSINKSLVTDSNTVNVFEFMYGIKTLELAQQFFVESGIFVSKNYTVDNLGAIGLDTDESIMPREDTSLTFIEYDLFVEAHNGSTITRVHSPILPSKQIVISGEVLDGSISSGDFVGTTRFSATDIKVFRNGVQLSNLDGSYAVTLDTNNRAIITIYSSILGLPSIRTSVFTVSYTPGSDSYILDLVNIKPEHAIINLRIFLRSVDPNRQLTPSVRSYSLKFKKFT